MARKIDELKQGERFGRLTVVREVRGTNKSGHATRMAEVRCECGLSLEVRVHNIVAGLTTSCGCLQRSDGSGRSRHGAARSRLYQVWGGLRNRCFNPKNAAYKNYGARGVTVSDAWNSFEAFHEWAMTHEFKQGLTVDRIDTNGPYAPENCRLVPMAAQARNRRDNIWLTAFGETRLLLEFAEDSRCVVSLSALRGRISAGWDPERAITQPSRQHKQPTTEA